MTTSQNRPDVTPRRRAGARGFTLVELMIVILILGVLAAVFLPDILGAKEQSNVTTTLGTMQRLSLGIGTFANKRGYYPPDDLHDPEGKLTFKADNGVNTGIESLVAFLSQSRADGADLSDMPRGNTDGDKDDKPLPLLGTSDRVEILDAFGMPLAYFSKTTQTGGFDKPQSMAMGDGQREQAKALRNAEGHPYGASKFQLLSAGADQRFGTDDDISWPERDVPR